MCKILFKHAIIASRARAHKSTNYPFNRTILCYFNFQILKRKFSHNNSEVLNVHMRVMAMN